MNALQPFLSAAIRGVPQKLMPAKTTVVPAPGPQPPPCRPRVEYFNLADMTNTDAKGFVRQIERYHVAPWGLYIARTVGGPKVQYLESWLLPDLNLRATVAHSSPSHHREPDFYLEIGEFTRLEPKRWKAVDHYLDIIVHRDHGAELHAVDELLAAHAAGLIEPEQANRAIEHAAAVLDGLASNGHNVERWLATQDITLDWL